MAEASRQHLKIYYSNGNLVKEQLMIFAQRFGTVLKIDVDPYAATVHFLDEKAADVAKTALHNIMLPNGARIFTQNDQQFGNRLRQQQSGENKVDRPKTASATITQYNNHSSLTPTNSSRMPALLPLSFVDTTTKLTESIDLVMAKLSTLETKVESLQNQVSKILSSPSSNDSPSVANQPSVVIRASSQPVTDNGDNEPDWHLAKLPSSPASFAPGQIVKASITHHSTSSFDAIVYAAEACLRLISGGKGSSPDTVLINDILTSVSCQLDCQVTIEDLVNKVNRYAQAFQVLAMRRPGQADMFGKLLSPRQLLTGAVAADYHLQHNAPIGVLIAHQLDIISICILPDETFIIFDPQNRSGTSVPYMVTESNIETVLSRLESIWPPSSDGKGVMPDEWDDDERQDVEFVVVKRYSPQSSLPPVDVSRIMFENSIKKLVAKFGNLENRTLALEENIGAVLKSDSDHKKTLAAHYQIGPTNVPTHQGESVKRPDEVEARKDTVERMRGVMSGFLCSICDERVVIEKLFIISSCAHFACRDCIHGHLAAKIKAGDYPVSCPFCQATFTEHESTSILEPSEIQALEKNMLNRMFDANCFHCPRPDCSYFAEVVPPRTFFECAMCGAEICTLCKQDWHEGPCAKIDGDSMAATDTAVSQFVRTCPRCTNGIEKTQGCNHIRCRCGAHFCYICGAIFDSGEWEDHACGQFETSGNILTEERSNSFDEDDLFLQRDEYDNSSDNDEI